MNDQFEIQVADVKAIPDHRWQQRYELNKALRMERDPLSPAPSLAETKANLQNLPSFVDLTMWWALDKQSDTIVGDASLIVFNEEMTQNQHLGQIDIQVAADCRRQGVGTELLRRITQAASEFDRSLIISNTHSNVPAGESFARRFGAEMGLVGITNQLEIADLDMEMMATWQTQAERLADEYEILFVEGHLPDDLLDAMVEVKRVMNTAPRDELDVEDFELSAEQYRQMEQMILQPGRERWIYAVRHKPSQKLAGYTEMTFRSSAPMLAGQGDTAVVPEFRGNKIGRWLKAAMITHIVNERPAVQYVRTGNAASNAPMLKINNEMGFKPHYEDKVWQLSIEKANACFEN